jgi:NAD(P)H-flavin reductase
MLSSAERWEGSEGGRPFLPRAFSVLRSEPAPAGGAQLEFLLEDVGPGTRRLCAVAPGEELYILGPLGSGFQPPRAGRRPLLVGGGVGIAPLAIWQDRLGQGVPALLGFRDAARARGAELLSSVRVATDDGSVGHHGLVTDLLEAELVSDGEALEVYACGPEPMLEAVRQRCTAHETPAQLAMEAGMACGYGACFGCVVPTRHGYVRLCLEGPVLDAALLGEFG